MDIDVQRLGEVCVLGVTGELKFGKPAALLRDRASDLLAAGERYFVVEMLRSPWLDSSGIGALVDFPQRARARRGVVELVLNARSRSTFTIVRLETMFEIFDDLDSALASFDEPGGKYRERF